MAKHQTGEGKEIQVTKPNSILEELTALHDTISKRAYELFENDGGLLGDALADWFRAERELVWQPAIHLRQKDGRFELDAALAGMNPENLDVRATPDDILITATEEHRQEGDEGTVHVAEFSAGRLFRSIHLPEPIDPASVKAEFRNGMLRLSAAVAKPAAAQANSQAA